MKIQASNPCRAACAATAFARLPVEEQLTVSNPKFLACARATATTRSLKESVGKETASFFRNRRRRPVAHRVAALRPAESFRRASPVVAFRHRQQFRSSATGCSGEQQCLACEVLARRLHVVFHFERGQTVSQIEDGLLPYSRWHSRQRRSKCSLMPVLSGLRWFCAPKQMPRPGLGNEAKRHFSESSCPPRTGRELAPSDQ